MLNKYRKSIIKKVELKAGKIIIGGFLYCDNDNFSIKVDGVEVGLKILNIKKIKNEYKIKFEFEVDIRNLKTENKKMQITFIEKNTKGYDDEKMNLNLNFKKSRKSYYKKWRFRVKDLEKDTLWYIGFNEELGLVLCFRPILPFDSIRQQILFVLGYVLGKLVKKKNRIILFEKDCKKFEESAWILYKYLIDNNYDNVYYSLDRNVNGFEKIELKYKKNIIQPHTLKQYYFIFSSDKYFGTEFPIQLINRDANNPLFSKHIKSDNCKCLMLRHGVQMLSNGSEFRRGFYRKGKLLPLNSKIVVSSKMEADDFLQTGEFEIKDLLVSGLPKFDFSFRNECADKILIMPTWRGWEHNTIINNPENSGYYKLIKEMVESVPKELLDKVIVMPHPIMVRYFEKTKTSLNKYIRFNEKYDDLLKEASILITDYSSIAFDAFFRGTNVLFYFKDKEYCMKKYCGDLVLSDNEMFGDVSYNKKKLSIDIINNYNRKQSEENQKNFRKMVEFNDRNNTERLVKLLKECNYI